MPELRPLPFVRIWQAGCSTGQEVYSLAILLEEEEIYESRLIYSTDVNLHAIDEAAGRYLPLARLREYTANYLAAGGTRPFSEYYMAENRQCHLSGALRRNVVFSRHDLAVDGPFHRFHVVLCRNVLIYFNEALVDRVHRPFYESLEMPASSAWGAGNRYRFTPMRGLLRGDRERSENLPKGPIAPNPPPPEGTDLPPGRRVKILLVDDQPNNLLALEAVLDHSEYNLVKAHSGEEALRRLLRDDFALILLDVLMPGLDGFETAELIRERERTRYTPIVFVTAIGRSEAHVARGYSAGAVDYLFKPLIPEILRSKVSAFVELF